MGLLDTGTQMTIITGPHRGRGKLTAPRGFGDKPGDSQQTVSYVLMGEALWPFQVPVIVAPITECYKHGHLGHL